MLLVDLGVLDTFLVLTDDSFRTTGSLVFGVLFTFKQSTYTVPCCPVLLRSCFFFQSDSSSSDECSESDPEQGDPDEALPPEVIDCEELVRFAFWATVVDALFPTIEAWCLEFVLSPSPSEFADSESESLDDTCEFLLWLVSLFLNFWRHFRIIMNLICYTIKHYKVCEPLGPSSLFSPSALLSPSACCRARQGTLLDSVNILTLCVHVIRL